MLIVWKFEISRLQNGSICLLCKYLSTKEEVVIAANMADDVPNGDRRFDYIKERISAAFPKLAGPKFDRQISTDELRLQLDVFVAIGVVQRLTYKDSPWTIPIPRLAFFLDFSYLLIFNF